MKVLCSRVLVLLCCICVSIFATSETNSNKKLLISIEIDPYQSLSAEHPWKKYFGDQTTDELSSSKNDENIFLSSLLTTVPLSAVFSSVAIQFCVRFPSQLLLTNDLFPLFYLQMARKFNASIYYQTQKHKRLDDSIDVLCSQEYVNLHQFDYILVANELTSWSDWQKYQESNSFNHPSLQNGIGFMSVECFQGKRSEDNPAMCEEVLPPVIMQPNQDVDNPIVVPSIPTKSSFSIQRASTAKYHASPLCNLWWPLNNSEIYLYYDPLHPDNSMHDEPFIFICPKHDPKIKESYKFAVVLEQLDEPYPIPMTAAHKVGYNLDEEIFDLKYNVFAMSSFQPSLFNSTFPWVRIRFNICIGNGRQFQPMASFVLNLKLVVASQISSPYSLQLHPMINTLTSRDILGKFLNSLGHSKGTFVEVGVNKGEFAKLMLSQWSGQRYILVDPWLKENQEEYIDFVNLQDRNKNMKETLQNTLYFRNKTVILRMTSVEAGKFFLPESVDIIYIDGLHHYEGVMNDLETWWPILKRGGIILGHDYLLSADKYTIFTVKPAVDEFARKIHLPVFHTPMDSYPTWFIFKPIEYQFK